MENKSMDFRSDERNSSDSILLVNNKADQCAPTRDTLKDQMPLLSTLINTIPNPAYYKNTHGVFVDCNTAFAETILGAPRQDIVGQSVYEHSEIIPRALSDFCSKHDEKLLNQPRAANLRDRCKMCGWRQPRFSDQPIDVHRSQRYCSRHC